MKLERTGVVLLGLLLMVSAVMSLAAAQDITPEKNILGGQDQACATCSIPETGVVSYESGSETNLLKEFGIDAPEGSDDAPPLKSYNECPDLIDGIMAKAKLNDDTDAVIGLYDLEQYQILLISRGDLVLEAIYDGESVTTYVLIPELLGEKKVSYSPKKVLLEGQVTEECSITTETSTLLYSVPIKLPETSYVLQDTYIVKKSRTDVYRTAWGVTIATLHTEGWFYVTYGSSITSVGDHSYWNIGVAGWQKCEYSVSTTGVGSTYAQHNTHFKFGSTYQRNEMNMWVDCDAWLSANDGGYTNSWYSQVGDGCTG